MDQDDKVVVLKVPVTPGEAAGVPSESSEGSEPSEVQPPSEERALPVGAIARKLSAQKTTATDPLAALKEAVETSKIAAGVQAAPVPEIKVLPRDTVVQPAEPPRGGKLRLMAGACVVLGVGWLVGLSTPSVDLDKAPTWMHQSVGVLNATFWSVERELEDRFTQLTNWNTSIVEASQAASPEKPTRVCWELGFSCAAVCDSSSGWTDLF